jgi:hypothetical protein
MFIRNGILMREFGGGGGNRTPVREYPVRAVYMRRFPFISPERRRKPRFLSGQPRFFLAVLGRSIPATASFPALHSVRGREACPARMSRYWLSSHSIRIIVAI